MHIQPHIPRWRSERLAGMNTDPDPQRKTLRPLSPFERALDLRRRSDCVMRPTEDDEERVPLSVNLITPEASNQIANQDVMLTERLPIPLRPKPLQQPRRSFDVGKEQRDRPCRLPGHSGTMALSHAPGYAGVCWQAKYARSASTTASGSQAQAVPERAARPSEHRPKSAFSRQFSAPDDSLNGLSRRRSRVRVPSLPSLEIPGNQNTWKSVCLVV
jgi:hypothetical protein